MGEPFKPPYEGWAPYCLMCKSMGRMSVRDFGWHCGHCGNNIGKDLEHYPPTPKHAVNDVVTVSAWWTVPEGQPVKCRVEKIWPWAPQWRGQEPKPHGYEVRPLEPGSHGRYIREDAIA